jgi:SAM-dependent methyltransferase
MSTPEMRARWAAAATAWEETNDPWQRQTLPVSTRMIELIAPQPGHTVLELGAGIGDTGFLAAELIQPGGTLITSDIIPEMLSAAQRRAEALGVTNVRFKQIDAQRPIDLAAASVDGVLGRWVFMMMTDPEAALREVRRILRPGGRLALAAWAGADENLWMAAPSGAVERRGALDPFPPGAPGPMTWADPAIIVEHLDAAGFDDPEVEPVEFSVRFDSVEDWWEVARRRSTRMASARPFDAQDVLAELRDAAAPYTAPGGAVALPARTWVAAATA